MEEKRVRKVQKRRNSFIPTKVRGIRADVSWWEMCDKVAKKIDNSNANEMIVRVVAEYCDKKLGENNGNNMCR